MPASLSPEEQAVWRKAVTDLKAVGRLRTTKRADLARYVRRTVESYAVIAELSELRILLRRLEGVVRRGTNADRALLERAVSVMTRYRYLMWDEQRRLSLLLLKFASTHRLTPRSRMSRMEQ
jgi:hypothetical protein